MATNTPRYNLSVPEDTDTAQDAVQAYRDNLVIIDNNLGGGGGSANIVELTQAEYDALPDTKLTDDTMYLIKDANSASDAEFTHVYGLYLDPNNIVYSSFTFDSTEHSWTAISDCILTGNMVPPDSATAYYVRLDGVQVFAGYSTVEDPFVYVKKGQVVTYRGKSGSSMKAYGVVAGSEVTFLSEYSSACYSTQEREVGCWQNGKPLYQKTYSGLSISCTNQGTWYSTGQNYGDIEQIINGECVDQYGQNIKATFGYMNASPRPIALNCPLDNRVITEFTIWYTKTTDTAGGGQWTPMAQPTHHYSTSEQVIGTWVDGKPIYEITLNPTVTVGSNTLAHGIANFKECISIKGKCKFDNGSDVLPLPYVSTNANYMIALGNVNATNYLIETGAYFGSIQDCYVTIQYTKTTD